MTAKQVTEQDKADAWNEAHAIGDRGILTGDDHKEYAVTTRSRAEVLSSHTAVIWLNEFPGCYDLSRIRAAKEAGEEVRDKIAVSREKRMAEFLPIVRAVQAAFDEQRRPQEDADLDDEQPISLTVRLTLGDVRKMRRVL